MPHQVLPRWAWVDLGAMALKGCSIFPKAAALLGPHRQIFSVISGHSWAMVTPLQSCSQCILLPQPTGQKPSVGPKLSLPLTEKTENTLNTQVLPSHHGATRSKFQLLCVTLCSYIYIYIYIYIYHIFERLVLFKFRYWIQSVYTWSCCSNNLRVIRTSILCAFF